MATLPVNRYSGAIWWRHAKVWLTMLWSSVAQHVFEPILFLFAFGFGLGAVIDEMNGVSYLHFVVPGMIAYAAMFSASFESTVSTFARFHMQRTWDAQLATPVTLTELLLGELMWSATKGMIGACSVFIVGALWAGLPAPGNALLAMILVAIGAMGFAACGLLATSFAKSWQLFSYFFTFWVTPMFLFSGTFFTVDRFPDVIQWLAWILPATHLIAVIRPLMLDLELNPLLAFGHVAFLIAAVVIPFLIARRQFAKRLFD
ncbi:MAG: ABC transporter permease [Geminicoccaceae bacterium]